MPKKSMFPTARWVCRATHRQGHRRLPCQVDRRPRAITLRVRFAIRVHVCIWIRGSPSHQPNRCHLRQGSHQPNRTQSSRQRRTTNMCVVAQDIGKSEISNDAGGGSHRMRFTKRMRVDSVAVASNKPRPIHTRGRQCRTTNNLVVVRDIGRAEGGDSSGPAVNHYAGGPR